MKTRIIHTKFWKDKYIANLPLEYKSLFFYYLTNEYVNIIWLYELTDRVVIFDTGINKPILQKIKKRFMDDKKILFIKDYVYLVNAYKYENYKGKKNETAKKKLLDGIPDDVKSRIADILDTPKYTPLIGTRNQKSEIRNKKLENRNKKREQILKKESLTQEDIDIINDVLD